MKNIRLTIRFTEEELEDIKCLRWYKKQTASQVIREAVQHYVHHRANQRETSGLQ